MEWICYNGEFRRAGDALLITSNRSFKWGDGLFETMKVFKGEILLKSLHLERLRSGLSMIGINFPEGAFELPEKNILETCLKNKCSALARIRLAVFREENNLFGFVIEARPLDTEANQWNEKGFLIDIYPLARKSMDGFSNLKSANYLPYVMAGLYATENGLDEALVLNHDNHICDSSKANIFLVKKNEVYTPALNQGCINGVMRRYIIDHLHQHHFTIHQQAIDEKSLVEADEVFLTNAIYGIRWVRSFRDKNYVSDFTRTLFKTTFSRFGFDL